MMPVIDKCAADLIFDRGPLSLGVWEFEDRRRGLSRAQCPDAAKPPDSCAGLNSVPGVHFLHFDPRRKNGPKVQAVAVGEAMYVRVGPRFVHFVRC